MAEGVIQHKNQMQDESSNGNNTPVPKSTMIDLEKQEKQEKPDTVLSHDPVDGESLENSKALTILVTNGSSSNNPENPSKGGEEELPKKCSLSRTTSSGEQCRVCQQEKDEVLIDLGCNCRGDLSKAHRSCIDAWFRTKGSNQCEICQAVAVNVLPPPPSLPNNSNYWVWRVDPTYRRQDRERGCFSPLWVAFSILIGGLMLDVLISVTLGVSALPINIIIGIIVVLGLGTAIRLVLEFFYEWSLRRAVQRVETNLNVVYRPGL